jgi:polyhydroxyalkanoate synthesis regulator phasin
MATKSATSLPFAQVQESIRSLQSGAEQWLESLRKEVNKLLNGKDRRKAIDDLFTEAKALPTDLQKKVLKTLKAFETRANQLLSDAQSHTKKRVGWLMSRLSLPSKHEVELLAKRLSSLEKKVEDMLNEKRGAA